MDIPLKLTRRPNAQEWNAPDQQDLSISEIVEQLTGFIRRQYPIFVFVTVCCLALGFVYLQTAPPRFTAHAMLLIDSSKLRILQEQGPVADLPIDTAQVETQVEILKSENIALSVVKELKLADDPEFAAAGNGIVGWIMQRIAPNDAISETKSDRRALGKFLKSRSIARVARTYVLDISFTSLSAARSSTIANAIADAYIVDQLASKYQATKRASVWLQDRIRELRQQASDADRAVLDYKEKNKIVAVGGGSSSGGVRLLGEQQLEDLNTQLGTARAGAEDAKARLERISDVMKREVPDAAVADSLRSEVINRLRNNYLDIAAKEAIWSARYGHAHLAAVNLRTQMAELRRSIHDELGRIAESYKSDYEIAKTRVEGLQRELQKLIASSQLTNRDRLGLSDLESTAKVYHSIYDNFLQRYMEAIQQQSFPITEARVISAAAPPEHKSSPLALPVLGIACLIGLVLSFAGSFVREAVDQVFRTTRQIESTLHVNCLAVLPLLARSSKSSGMARAAGSVVDLEDDQIVARESVDQQKREMVNTSNSAGLVPSILGAEASKPILHEYAKERRLRFPHDKFMRHVVDEPLSAFAEALRSVKVAADVGISTKAGKVIGVVSTLPGEGKSTVASNLAELIAHSAKRVVLIDGDLRNPTLTRILAPRSKAGLLEVLDNQLDLDQVICVDNETSLGFVPAVLKSRVVHTAEILASDKFEQFIDAARKTYDYIVLDLPPLAPVVDVRATTQVVDSYLYVIEWGKTGRGLIQQQLLSAPSIYDRLLGVVLNKSNLNVMQRYEGHYGNYYHRKYYGSYGSSA